MPSTKPGSGMVSLKGGMGTRQYGKDWNNKHDAVKKDCGCQLGYPCSPDCKGKNVGKIDHPEVLKSQVLIDTDNAQVSYDHDSLMLAALSIETPLLGEFGQDQFRDLNDIDTLTSVDVKRVSHSIDKVRVKREGGRCIVTGDLTIKGPRGKMLSDLLKDETPVRFAMRSLTKSSRGGNFSIEKLITWDCVATLQEFKE